MGKLMGGKNFQNHEFQYGVPHQPHQCDISDVTLTSKESLYGQHFQKIS